MIRTIGGLLALVVAAAGVQAGEPSPAAAGPADPVAWLLKAGEAARLASYQGVVVYRDSETMETLRVVHRHQDGREQERLTSLSGAPRDTVRDEDQITCALPHVHPAETSGSPQNLLPALSRQTLGQVAPHYGFRGLGESRIAGRISVGVAIEPRDEFRYGYQVWADKATAVPLKVSLVDRKGRMVEEMLYTEIQFPARIADSAFALGPGVRNLVLPRAPAAAPAASQVAQATASSAWAPASLPPGFQIAMRNLKPAPDGEGAVEHVLLSDGLSAVSIFSARMAQNDKLFRGFSHMGAMNAYGRMVGLFHVTVVGEVPQATVRMIGDSLTPAAQ